MIHFSTKTPEQLFDILSQLEDAVSTGVYSIAQDGKTITFRTLGEVENLHKSISASLGLGPRPIVHRILRPIVRVR